MLADSVTRIQEGLLSAKDKRMKMIDEMFGSIKFIKFFAWEEQWVAKILEAIRLFDILRQSLSVLPYALMTYSQTKVSLNRVSDFLNVEEVPEDAYTPTRQVSKDPQELLIENATFRWPNTDRATGLAESSPESLSGGTTVVGDAQSEIAASTTTSTAIGAERVFELRDISVKPALGKLTVVTGPTASGKTALLMAFLGELNRISGTAVLPKNPTIVDEYDLRNSISYAAQTPWLQQMSIKDNIVFEYPFDKERYDAVVDACALKPDFRVLEDGDMTEIGVKGVSLSGGQKARVALARAVYAPTQYVILDDIFSAVDSHTARFLFDRLIQGPLLAYRAVILVTHHVELVLPGTYYLIQMSEGRIERQGTVSELEKQGLLDFLANDPSVHSKSKDDTGDVVTSFPNHVSDPIKTARKLVEEEERSEGMVKWIVYKVYMKASSGPEFGWAYGQSNLRDIAYGPLTSLPYNLIARNNTLYNTNVKLPDANDNPLFYVTIYCGLGILSSLLVTVGEWVWLTAGMRSGLVLFCQLLSKLSTATFRFFDTTPTGRILNRFGKDFETIDSNLSFSLYFVSSSVASFMGAVITVIFVVPFFTPVAFIIAFMYFQLSVRYLKTGRDLRRMESTTRSPILAGFSDLVSGIITGLLLRFDVLGAVSVFATTIIAISGYISAGYAALSIVSAMTFSINIFWTCRSFTDLELNLNSVERVVEFLDVPQEPPVIVETNRVPAYWPSSSESVSMLVVQDLEVKYTPELPSVLSDISFSLKARERVGLLGRTGCGKSTLAMSLLRFVEPTNGRILIDNIDITSIGTRDLRSRITFIPQDATLFAGTVRENLDPFNEHTDTECLDALSRVHLITSSSQLPSHAPSIRSDIEGSTTLTQSESDTKVIIKLDSLVAAGGQNFSNGQRQLLAMARALLRQSNVIILDEATSSIDKAADTKIQAVIREEFNQSLLLTIAHRLGTIIDYDRLIVLDKGRIAEFDTPWNLIHKEGGSKSLRSIVYWRTYKSQVFREMCLQSGTYTELEGAAKARATETAVAV
ncbi:hypothetical protein Clacol_002186 [Clathrus columnatus]|uniref:P-loop containing nucleoside triphosphate hydrolase protein n=1 Tax=Clathrus columnatus TaxID=1419009 RepID=A0AAV5A039_9AGAM|nr:hypothetical protein Clacol_002186 [Clathrus columnatus]